MKYLNQAPCAYGGYLGRIEEAQKESCLTIEYKNNLGKLLLSAYSREYDAAECQALYSKFSEAKAWYMTLNSIEQARVDEYLMNKV